MVAVNTFNFSINNFDLTYTASDVERQLKGIRKYSASLSPKPNEYALNKLKNNHLFLSQLRTQLEKGKCHVNLKFLYNKTIRALEIKESLFELPLDFPASVFFDEEKPCKIQKNNVDTCTEGQQLDPSKIPIYGYAKASQIKHLQFALNSVNEAIRWIFQQFKLLPHKEIHLFTTDHNPCNLRNKNWLIFSPDSILCNPKTATDEDYSRIAETVAYKYFRSIICSSKFPEHRFLRNGLARFLTHQFTSTDLVRFKNAESIFKRDSFSLAENPLAGAFLFQLLSDMMEKTIFFQGLALYLEKNSNRRTTPEIFLAFMKKIPSKLTEEEMDKFKPWFSRNDVLIVHATMHYDQHTKELSLLFQNRTSPLTIPIHFYLFDAAKGDRIYVSQDFKLCVNEAEFTFALKDMPLLYIKNENPLINFSYEKNYTCRQLFAALQHEEGVYQLEAAQLLIMSFFDISQIETLINKYHSLINKTKANIKSFPILNTLLGDPCNKKMIESMLKYDFRMALKVKKNFILMNFNLIDSETEAVELLSILKEFNDILTCLKRLVSLLVVNLKNEKISLTQKIMFLALPNINELIEGMQSYNFQVVYKAHKSLVSCFLKEGWLDLLQLEQKLTLELKKLESMEGVSATLPEAQTKRALRNLCMEFIVQVDDDLINSRLKKNPKSLIEQFPKLKQEPSFKLVKDGIRKRIENMYLNTTSMTDKINALRCLHYLNPDPQVQLAKQNFLTDFHFLCTRDFLWTGDYSSIDENINFWFKIQIEALAPIQAEKPEETQDPKEREALQTKRKARLKLLEELLRNKAFDWNNSSRVLSVFQTLCKNLPVFHDETGDIYEFFFKYFPKIIRYYGEQFVINHFREFFLDNTKMPVKQRNLLKKYYKSFD